MRHANASRSTGRTALVALCIGGVMLLAGCASKRADADRAQRQALEHARALCRDFGYQPGTLEFAQCTQAEYDRQPLAPAKTAQPQTAPPQTAQPAPAPAADSEDSAFIRWLKRPNVCQQAGCTVR